MFSFFVSSLLSIILHHNHIHSYSSVFYLKPHLANLEILVNLQTSHLLMLYRMVAYCVIRYRKSYKIF